MPAHFNPEFDPADVNTDYGQTGGDITVPTFTADYSPFKFWCQKTLPLVFDDSLSYYEVLCKLVTYVNNLLTDLQTATGSIGTFAQQFVINQEFLNQMAEQLGTNTAQLEAYINARMVDFSAAYEELQAYVNLYFANLDVQEEINTKLDQMAQDGTLDTLLQPFTEDWLENMTAEITADLANQNQTLTNQNARISVLEGRMDTFSTLPAGSTSANAELVDIRTNFLGETYSNAGEAVRASDLIASGYYPLMYSGHKDDWYLSGDDALMSDACNTLSFDITKYKGGKLVYIFNVEYNVYEDYEMGAKNIIGKGSAIIPDSAMTEMEIFPANGYLTLLRNYTDSGSVVGQRLLFIRDIPEDETAQYYYLPYTDFQNQIPGEQSPEHLAPTGCVFPNYMFYVTNWSKTPVDLTLTQAGEAADAKATGDAIAEVSERLGDEYTRYNYTENKNISQTTGDLIDEQGTCVSDFIPYTWTGGTTYDCGDNTKTTYQIAFYDSNKTFITSFRNPSTSGNVTYRNINAETQVTSGVPAYIRFSFKSSYAGSVYQSTLIHYVAAEITVKGLQAQIGSLDDLDTTNKNNLVDALNEVNGKIPDISTPIQPKDTSFMYESPNIADPSRFVVGEYVNQVTGAFAELANQERTDYIHIEGGKTYCIVPESGATNIYIRYAFYDESKMYISGAYALLSDINSIVTAPNNARFIVVSGTITYMPYMIAQSNSAIPFAEYGEEYLLPQYLPTDIGEDVLLNLPEKIYATTGIELNIYFENITENWKEYEWNVQCSKGMQLERGYCYTPANSDTGTTTLTITAKRLNGTRVYSKTVSLITSASTAGNSTTKSVIILGDSTTDNGGVIVKLHEDFTGDVMSVTTLGTRGTAPNNHEGRSGWTLNDYFTKASITYPAGDPRGTVYNPFYNPTSETFDAAYYFANSGVSVPDWFIINMGINDMFNYTSDTSLETQIDTCLGYLSNMITSIKAVSANIKIGICVTIPPNSSQDAFGKAYACGQTRDRYKRNNSLWASAIIAEFDGKNSDNIYVIPIHTNLDTVYNMGMETLPVNARNTDITYQSPIANGGVHPVLVGYWQIADVYKAFLKCNA